MRRPIASIAFILALLTGVWFGQAYTFFAPADSISAADTDTTAVESAVWRYYDAIDTYLRTGDDAALFAVLAPAFVDHVDEPGSPSDRDGLVRYLASLRETHPALRLVPQEMVAQGDRVVVRLAPIDGTGGTILDIPVAGKEPWPQVDLVRVHDGRIVERWGDATGYAPTTELFAETLAFPYPGERVPLLRRMTIAPGVVDTTTFHGGQTIIAVEAGMLDITAEVGTSPADAGNAPLPGGQTATLSAGDTMTIADGAAFAVANRSTTPAVFLALTLVEPVPMSLRARADTTTYDPVTGTDGISVQDLNGNAATTRQSGQLSAGLARITLAPGARLAPHPVAGLEIVVVESGTVAASLTTSSDYSWVRDPSGRSTFAERWEQLTQGYSLTVGKGATSAYANESTQPVTVLLLALTAE